MAMIFMISTIITPVYGATEENSGPGAVVQEDTSQEYEENADSWRYRDGQNITTEQTDEGISPNMSARASFVPWSKVNGGFINSKGNIIEGAIKKGIDVSAWQGEIDWDKVKASDIDFAIIRCGFGSDEPGQDDSQWLRNVKECERLGIPYGVYLYSYAEKGVSPATKAKREAAHVLRLLREAGAEPDYPVYYDLEDSTLLNCYTKSEILTAAKTFCSTIEARGYRTGIYANLYWWNNYLTSSTYNNYERWVAQYYYQCDYGKDYRIWQSASDGEVSGINGNVDINFEFQKDDTEYFMGGFINDENGNTVFRDYDGTIAKSQWVAYRDKIYHMNDEGLPVTGLKEIDGYTYYFDEDGVMAESEWITIDGKKRYFKSTGQMATGYNKIGYYYYLFDSSGIMKTGTVTTGGKQYKLFSSGQACLYSAKTKSALNYRTGPSSSYKKKGTYPKGKTVYVTRTSNGWSKLSTGYWVNSSYLKKVTTYPKTVSTFKSYKVKTTTAVNYRTGPSTGYKLKGTYAKGKILTIVSVKNGWGKTGGGYWVKLSYTKKI